MASPQAILRAAKAVPGGARPTPAPQGSQIGMGQISPLAWQLASEPGYAAAYQHGPFLPRPARTFTEGAFGPFSPILPVPVDTPPPGAELADPRRWQYPVGYNLPTVPGQDGFKLASFATLSTLSSTYSVARTCIERRKYDIAGLDWDIVPTKEATKAYQGDHAAMKDFGERRAKAIKFFRQPDPNYFSFASFMKAALEEIFVFDALSVLMKPKRGRGLKKGVLGSDLDCLQLVDGPTIRPLVSLDGGYPRPPAPAYSQFLYGVPRSDIMAMVDERDIVEAGLEGYKLADFATDQMLYLPVTPRPFTPYGFSAVEMALIVITTGLRKQAYQLQYYDEGTIPGCFISPGDPNITPNQIRELQDALQGYAGDQAWHHKIIVLPPNAKVMPQRAQDLADQFDEIIMTEVAMVFDVDPMSLGIIPKVSTVASPFAAREMAQASRTVHDRTSTKPLLKYWCDIFNAILHRVCGQDDMRFTFAGMDEAQDQAAMTDLLVKQVQNGFISIDEAREELQRTAWGLDETSGPLVFTQMGPVPLNQVIQMMQMMQPMQGGQNSPANSGNSTDTRPRGVHHPPSSRPVGTHNPRQGLPSGAGMRTGLPASGSASGAGVSDTPAHAAARAHQGTSRPSKAVRAELDNLARHLRKGRDIATWMPRYLSGVVMATVSEDLTKGIGIDEAVRNAVTVALPASEYEWRDDTFKASSRHWPGWQQDRQLQQQYRQRIRGTFTQAANQAKTLIRQWLTGVLAVSAMQLARMILGIFAKLLLAALTALWREAWHMGRQAAHAVLADAEADWGGWELGSQGSATDVDGLEEWIASHGRDALEGIEDTLAEELAAYLDGRARAGADPDAIAAGIAEVLDADNRSDMIAATELHRAEQAAVQGVYRGAGVMLKQWLTEPGACPVCLANEAEGPVAFGAPFQSGAMSPPQHPHCRCSLVPAVPEGVGKLAHGRSVELSGQEYWPAGSYPHGPAMGGGAPMHAAHNAEGTQEYIPGGVPGMTAGGEPPRWPGSEAPAVVQDYEPGTGRAGGSRGGGTVLAPYRDMSDETHTQGIEDGDDAAWPEHRGVPNRPGRDWPAPYMDGYWPRGGHGTGQAPGMSVGATDRGRPPNAVGKGGTPGLTSRSGMISLDLPEGTIKPLPGGVTDHHVTVVYLGPDVGDEAFERACLSARIAAASVAGPLHGSVGGIGRFPASSSSEGKVPAWAGVSLPGSEILRKRLEHLSASEHKNWKPHVTLTYLGEGEPLPAALPHVPVTFTHLSVHRGDDVRRFRLGDGEPETAMAVKGASDLHDPSPVEAEHVYSQLAANYPAKAIEWVRGIRWIGPVEIPLDRVDTDDEDSWAASHQPDAVTRFAREIKAGTGHTHPVVMVQKPGHLKAMVVDGHHRFLACRKLGWPCKSYVGFVPADDGPWDETHSSQRFQGDDPRNKHQMVSKESVNYRAATDPARECSTCGMYRDHKCDLVRGWIEPDDLCDRWIPRETAKGAKPDTPVAAGIAVRAADTGRILMLQRAFDEDDGAGGRWEFPGGCLEPGEEAFEAARREWAEETGCPVPAGELTGIWGSSNGKYRGFVLTVPSEDAVDILGARDAVENPDDPDGDLVEALAWWEPKLLRDNPAVRDELAQDSKRVRRALKSAETPMLEATPHLLGPHGLWGTPDRHVGHRQKLPNYIEQVAAALQRDQGMSESEAIATAINAVKRWARGDLHWGPHRKVTPEVVAASRRALQEWEELRASHAG